MANLLCRHNLVVFNLTARGERVTLFVQDSLQIECLTVVVDKPDRLVINEVVVVNVDAVAAIDIDSGLNSDTSNCTVEGVVVEVYIDFVTLNDVHSG